jgi:lysophospholipase L1-like esterase
MKLFPLPLLLVAAGVCPLALWVGDKPANTPPVRPGPSATVSAATPTPLPLQPADVPAIRYNSQTREPDRGFVDAHEKYLAVARQGQARLVFFGDSITWNWSTKGWDIWKKSFSQWQPANFGASGDRTQHVLWRIENGELDGLHPKAVVVLIGTNNVGGYPAEAIARGVAKIVETIRAKAPDAKVLLLAIFPRGEKASTPAEPNKARDTVAQVNAIIARLADNQHVFFLDIGSKFLEPDGSIRKEIMPDFVHPSTAGHQIWADAITPKLTELMK